MAKFLNIFFLIISILQECTGVEEQGECTKDTKDECDEISLKQKYSEYRTWHNGKLSKKVDFAHGKHGWGLFTNETVSKEEILLTVAPEDLITVEDAFTTVGKLITKKRDLDCGEALALLIVLESRKKQESTYWPWINILPTSHEMLLPNWPEKYDRFLMPHILESKREKIKFTTDALERINRSFNNPNAITNPDAITLEELKFAVATIRTRQAEWFKPKKHPKWFYETKECGAIAPLFDMINHGPVPNCEWATSLEDGLVLRALQTIDANQELLINYRGVGAKQNVDMLATYGFTSSDISSQKLEFTNSELIKACQVLLFMKKEDCELRIELTNHLAAPDHIDMDCNTKNTILQHVTSEEWPMKVSETAKTNELFGWILQKRKWELRTIQWNLDGHEFESNEEKYQKIILDLITSEKAILDKCDVENIGTNKL